VTTSSYIRMTQFTEQTTDGLKKAISDITGKVSNDKLKGYILDLCNNPGGLLHYHLIKDHLDLATRNRRFTRRLSKSKHSFAVLVFEEIFAAPARGVAEASSEPNSSYKRRKPSSGVSS
jgi:hypothetical protein